MIEIAIGGDKLSAGSEQFLEVFVDRHVSRQLRQGIGVARGLDLQVGDHSHEFPQVADSAVEAIARDDETFADLVAAQGADGARYSLDPRSSSNNCGGSMTVVQERRP